MLTTVMFMVGIAVVGAVCYLALRPVVVECWKRWHREREQAQVTRLRDRRRQELRDEAIVSVLSQLAQKEQATRSVGRKAA